MRCATVVPGEPRVVLERGDGEVKPGMVILAEGGLAGRVRRVDGEGAEVLYVSDPGSAIDVVVPRTGARGVLRGTRLEYLPESDEVAVGDRVATSGIGGLPPRLVVGEVVRVEKVSSEPFQRVVVRPAVDVTRLERVVILL
jgi:rod shape-determining protein MreC